MPKTRASDHTLSFLLGISLLFVAPVLTAQSDDSEIDSGFDDFDAEDAIEGESFNYVAPSLPTAEGGIDTDSAYGTRRVPRHYTEISMQLPKGTYTAIAIDPGDAEVIFVGGDGVLYKTDDGGESWRPVLTFARGPSPVGIELLSKSANRVADDATDNAESPDVDTDDDDEIDPEDAAEDGEEIEVETIDTEIEEVQTQSNDDVDVLQDLPDGDLDTRSRLFPRQLEGVRRIVFLDADGQNLVVATPFGLYRSRDGGESFVVLDRGGTAANDIRDVAVDPNNAERIFIASGAGTFKADLRKGNKFEQIPLSAGAHPSLGVVAKNQGGETVVIVGNEFGMLRSTDGGQTFRELLLKGLPATEAVGTVNYDPRTEITYAGTQAGLFAGERGDAILERRQVFAGAAILSISIDPTRQRGIAVGVFGRGVYESENSGIDVYGTESGLKAIYPHDIARPPNDTDALTVATASGVYQNAKGEGLSVTRDRVRTFVKATRKEPTVVETMEQALIFSRMRAESFKAIQKRLRFSSLLPTFTVTGELIKEDDGFISDDLFVQLEFDEDGNVEIEDLETFNEQTEADNFWRIFAFAVWNTDGIIYNQRELNLNRRSQQFVKTEERIAARVTSLYEARRRLQAGLFFDSKEQDPIDRARLEMRMAEFTALLDAATGNWFTQESLGRGAKLEELSDFDKRKLQTQGEPRLSSRQ